MYGCEWDDETGAIDAFKQFGYDGEDFLARDFKDNRWISPVQQGIPTVQKWNSNRGFIESENNYYSTECIEWLKKYLDYGRSSLQRKGITSYPALIIKHYKFCLKNIVYTRIIIVKIVLSLYISYNAVVFFPAEWIVLIILSNTDHVVCLLI